MDNFTKKWQDFHEGKLSKKEAIEFLHFLESDLGKRSYQKLLKETWAEEEEIKSIKGTQLSKTFRPKSDKDLPSKNNEDFFNSFHSTKISALKSILTYAACLIALLLVFKNLGFWLERNKEERKIEQEIVWLIKSNPRGIKSKILLPDSSWVYLNAGSEIKYPENFVVNRQVILTGEAFFEVFRDKDHPFTVEASHIKTQVLGTSFNVNSVFPESVEIGLATGSLKILNPSTGEELILSPGEASNISSDKGEMKKYSVDPKKIAPWKEGILQFNHEDFERVVKKLENWYGVEITIKGETPKEKCNGDFPKNTYLTNVLNVLGHALNFSFDINKNQVTINTNNMNE
ncbi:FecR family protein [Cyclobacterium sediminis]